MVPKIHVSRNQDALGVFTEEQLRTAISRGSVYASDYCWKSGMNAWATVGQTYPHLLPSQPAGQPAPPAYPAPHFPSQAHAQAYQSPESPSSHSHTNIAFPTDEDRFLAFLLDALFMAIIFCLLMVSTAVLLGAIAGSSGMSYWGINSSFRLIMCGCLLFGSPLYYGILGNTSQHATWGQRIMGFMMVDARTGMAPSDRQVWGWAFYRGIITTCCFCVGLLFFIPILNDPRKQSAFDSWSGIMMVKK
jgi:uncharacterized RDD family membrane protein YckC